MQLTPSWWRITVPSLCLICFHLAFCFNTYCTFHQVKYSKILLSDHILCVLYGSLNKQRLFPPYSINWFFNNRNSVFTVRYELSLCVLTHTVSSTRWNIKYSTFWPHFLCSVRISEQTACISPIQHSLFLYNRDSVYCAVRAESLSTVRISFCLCF